MCDRKDRRCHLKRRIGDADLTRSTRLLWKNQNKIKITGVCLAVGVLAFLVWSVSVSKEMTVFVAVDVGDLPPGLVLNDLTPGGVEVQISGPKYLIKTLSDTNHKLVLDPTGVTIGINRIELQKDRFPFPEGITVSHIHPSILTLKVEKAGRKQVPVMVSYSGDPATGYRVADAVARPSSVILSGPESALSSLDKAMTKPIDIQGLSESFRREIALDLSETFTIESSPDVFHAEIFLEEKTISRKFSDITVEGLGTSFKHSIRPQTINIEINGPMNVLEKMDADKDIRAYVDLKALAPGVYVRPAAISLPLNTILVAVTPEIFSVTIE